MNKPIFPKEPRDLRGYGRTPPNFSWPNGAYTAVSLVVNFEEGAELAVSDGDASTETVVEVASVVPQGRWDQGTEQQFAYGTRIGVWRVLDALARRSYPITWYMCGRAIARLPDIAKDMVAAGHKSPATAGLATAFRLPGFGRRAAPMSSSAWKRARKPPAKGHADFFARRRKRVDAANPQGARLRVHQQRL